jgi:hypothetical protein
VSIVKLLVRSPASPVRSPVRLAHMIKGLSFPYGMGSSKGRLVLRLMTVSPAWSPSRDGRDPHSREATCDWCGRLAQLAERLFYTQEVAGSNPALPTSSLRSEKRVKMTKMGLGTVRYTNGRFRYT